jgi:hypothetical protein
MTKQHTPNFAGIKPIKTNSHALSNTVGGTGPYGKKLSAGPVNHWTGPQPALGSAPTATSKPNQKPQAGKASAKPSHAGNK